MAAADASAQADALRERGATLLDLGRPQEAMTALAGSMRLDPDACATYALMALALRRLDRDEDSRRVLENGLQRHPNEEWLHRLSSQAYARAGDLDSALVAAEEAHRLRPDVWQSKHQLVDVLLDLRRFDDARLVAEALVALAPTEAAAHNQLGRVALERRHLIEAEHCFRQALALAPGEAVFHDNVGIVLYQQGRIAAATRFFDSAVSADPTRRNAQHNLYGSSKTLKQHSLLPNPKLLLERISPKAYQYFLHREGESFGMLATNYVVKLLVPLALLTAALTWGYVAAVGHDDIGGTVALWFVLASFVGLFTIGWMLRVPPLRRWLEPRPAEVAFYSNVLPILFNPLWLLIGGGLWMWRKPDDWELGLVALLVGLVFSGRVVARAAQGWGYALLSRTHVWRGRQVARASAALDRSPVGRPVRATFRLLRQPYSWLVIAFGVAVLLDGSVWQPIASLFVLIALGACLLALFGSVRRVASRLAGRHTPVP
jgi:Flp pilus assembly protein TadD